ncbi:MAG TPA: glycerophosphodiester phosphodiesterase family protein [Acidimicrobiia bacterium]
MHLTRPPHRPLVFAHRGASALAPENTVAAFARAVEVGADGVELDVRLTRDGTMVVHHDASIPRFGIIADRTFDDLRTAAPSVPTLEEAVAACADLVVNIELKNDPAEPDFDGDHSVADLVVEWAARWRHRVVVSSFNHDTVTRVRHLDPAVATGQLVDRTAYLDSELDGAAESGHLYVIPHKRHMRSDPAGVVAAAAGRGLQLIVWTVDGARSQRELAAAGVAAIVCNNPKRALARLG